MAVATILLECPKCGQKFRIRTAPGTVHVTCPGCRRAWEWPDDFPRTAPKREGKPPQAAWPSAIASNLRAIIAPRQISLVWLGVVFIAGAGVGMYVGSHWWRKGGEAPGAVAIATNATPSNGLPASIADPLETNATPQVKLTLDELLPSNNAAGAQTNRTNH